MPRSARKESGYGIYHVMMRGINRQAIFDDEEDCHRFMDILAGWDRGQVPVPSFIFSKLHKKPLFQQNRGQEA